MLCLTLRLFPTLSLTFAEDVAECRLVGSVLVTHRRVLGLLVRTEREYVEATTAPVRDHRLVSKSGRREDVGVIDQLRITAAGRLVSV